MDVARVLVNGVPLSGATNGANGELSDTVDANGGFRADTLLDENGNPTGWREVEFDLTPFIGQNVTISFEFDSVDGFFNNGEGWYVDDVKVSVRGFTPQDAVTRFDGSAAATRVAGVGDLTGDGADDFAIVTDNALQLVLGRAGDAESPAVAVGTAGLPASGSLAEAPPDPFFQVRRSHEITIANSQGFVARVVMTSAETQGFDSRQDLVDRINLRLGTASSKVVAFLATADGNASDEGTHLAFRSTDLGTDATLSVSGRTFDRFTFSIFSFTRSSASVLGFAAAVAAQGTGTPFELRAITDAEGFLGLAPHAAGDVDGDTIDDLILTGPARSLVVFGSASLASGALPSGTGTVRTSDVVHLRGIGDFDGDGIDDLAGARFDSGPKLDESGNLIYHQVTQVSPGGARSALTASLGDPALIFEAGRPVFTDTQIGARALLAPVGDVDRDGHADLLVADQLGSLVRLFRGQAPMPAQPGNGGAGSGAVENREQSEIFTFDLAPPTVPAADLLGRPGLTLRDVDAGAVSSQIRDAFALEGGTVIEGGKPVGEALARARVVGDINGDGLDDLLVEGASTAYFLLGPVELEGLTAIAPHAEIVVDTASLGRVADRLGDIDGDGITDLVFHRIVGSNLVVTAVLSGAESGPIDETHELLPRELNASWVASSAASRVRTFTLTGTFNADATSVSVLEFDGQANDDLLVFGQFGANIVGRLFRATSVVQGSLTMAREFTSSQPASALEVAIPGDVNGDGLDDVIVLALRRG